MAETPKACGLGAYRNANGIIGLLMTINAFEVNKDSQAERIAAEVRARIDAGKQARQAEGTNGDDGLFGAALDAVNPLQHIPGVSSVYRTVTGDDINPLSSMAGGFLFGGPIGMGVGAASSFIEILTGKSPAEHAMALLSGMGDDENTNVAGNETEEPAGPMGIDALVGSVEHRAQDDASVLSDAEARQRPGFGAAQSTVEYSSNIWSKSAIMDVTDKYDDANDQNNQPANSRANDTA